ncbi:MAG: hypothetical protein IH993_07100, partial [Proteobacteria bacterium]|nr:hypothetical protein [Pseudomonadota bacterium]
MAMLESLATETVTDAAVLRAVERAIGELRRGEPVLLYRTDGAAALILAAEQTSEAGLARLGALAGGAALLVLTARRASALGIGPGIGQGDAPPAAGGVVTLEIEDLRARAIVELADPTGGPRGPAEAPALAPAPGVLAAAAVDLA